MNKIEGLKIKIETERVKLNGMLLNGTLEDAYSQSVLLDRLIENYIVQNTHAK